MLRGGLGQAARVAAGQALAVGRSGSQGRESRVGVRQGLGGAGGAGGQFAVPRGQRRASKPGLSQGGVADQEPGPGLQIGAELAEAADGGRAIARFSDLRLGHGGLGARVDVGELRAPQWDGRRCAAGRGRWTLRRSFDHGHHAVARSRRVPVCAERLGRSPGLRRVWQRRRRPAQPPGGQCAAGGAAVDSAAWAGRCFSAGVSAARRMSSRPWPELAQVDQGGVASASSDWGWRASAEIPVPYRAASRSRPRLPR